MNVLWGFFNIVVGYVLLRRIGDFDLKVTAIALALGLGILVMSLFHARAFGPLHGGDRPTS